jgi:uncharacterized protein with PIN domain
MKLVLDEHYSRRVAEQLRERGYDVVAVEESTELHALPDDTLLRWARSESRVVVTENVRDFMPLHSAFLARGESHFGIVFTSPRAFSRRRAAVGRLISALATFLDDRVDTDTVEGGVIWL